MNRSPSPFSLPTFSLASWFVWPLIFLFASASAFANPLQDDLLEPEKAFQLQTRVVNADTVEASWKIADGYYLYRDKFKFEPLDSAITIKETKIPPGKKKRDEFFGEVETFRKEVKAVVTLTRTQSVAQTVKLKITAQGCADVGVCYPPQTQTVSLQLPASKAGAALPVTQAPSQSQAPAPQSLAALNDLLAPSGGEEFLEPDRAFRLSILPLDAQTVLARIDIAPGYYLYRDKTKFQASGGAQLAAYTLPPGKSKVDAYFGKTEVYYERMEVRLPLAAAAQTAELTANYQGCADKGICYPPITKKVSLTLDGAAAATGAGAGPGDGAVDSATSEPAPRTPAKTFALAVLSAFGVGLLLTFTPCVLPMIPILSSIIVGQGGQSISKLRGGMLSTAYVLGTAVTYTAAGVIAGATGDQLQAYFQNAWAIGIFAAIFVLLALSMFGFYELQMPSFVQSRLQARAQTVQGGSFAGVFFMGLLSALIVGACVSPLLISALSVAIAQKDPVLGGAIMFAMSLGMGVILIAIGVGAGYLLPRAGAWMNIVKYVFGVLLLAVAIYLLGVLPAVPVLLLWAALFIVSGIYLGATDSLSAGASGWRYLWKGVGTVLLVWGVLALIGGLQGNRDIMHPVTWGAATVSASSPGAIASAGGTEAHLPFRRVTTLAELERELAAAKAASKPVILDFYATWCTDCVRMEKTTFADPGVRAAMAPFVLIQADVTDNTDESRKLKQRVNVLGPPAMLFFRADGSEQADLRFYGYKNAPDFRAWLARASG